MGSVELLSHTADTGFRANSRDLPELFEISAAGMFSLEYDLKATTGDHEERIELAAGDLESLMEEWLSELLFLHDARAFAPQSFKVESLAEEGGAWRLRATVLGTTMDDSFEQTGPQIKAVTLHGLSVTPASTGYQATVYLDV